MKRTQAQIPPIVGAGSARPKTTAYPFVNCFPPSLDHYMPARRPPCIFRSSSPARLMSGRSLFRSRCRPLIEIVPVIPKTKTSIVPRKTESRFAQACGVPSDAGLLAGSPPLPQIRIAVAFLGHRCGVAVPGQDRHGAGQRENVRLETFHKRLLVSARQVATAYRTAEQAVAA